MKFTVSHELFETFPGLKVGALVVKGLRNNVKNDESYQYLCHSVDRARKDFIKSEREMPEDINAWVEAFQKVGISPETHKPSNKALFDRIVERGELPNINPIVSITNAISVSRGCPFGAHDLDKVVGEIRVGQNLKKLPYRKMGETKFEQVGPEEIAYTDSEEILTRHWIWRQGEKSKVTDQTSNIFIPIDCIGKSDEEIINVAEESIVALRHFLGDLEATFEIVSSENTSVDLDQMSPLKFNDKYQVAIHTQPIKRDQQIIDRILHKAVEEILPSRDALEALLKSGRRIKVYQGFDPTADTLHIGHTVMMRKLEDFRKLGHEVIMLIGDFTGRIGDPTDKGSARKKLTEAEVRANLRNYKEQASAIIDIDNADNPVQVVFNNDWLGQMSFAQVIDLCSEFTVQQMMKRDMFQKRLEEDKPIYLHEFLYPLMQGWDSAHMGVDVELGGNDQLFNMLAGRQLVGDHLLKEKFVIAGKLLTTADGKKMGKSEGNMIKLSDTPNDIYGKVMAFPDQSLLPGFEILTSIDSADLKDFEEQLSSGNLTPMNAKKVLARKIVSELKGEAEAEKAAQFFEDVYQKGVYNENITELRLPERRIDIKELLLRAKLAKSNSDAQRLITQGAVQLNSEKIGDWKAEVDLKDGDILKAGRERRMIIIDI